MIDIDYGPGVFGACILLVFIAPAIYGYFLVDRYWKKHQESDDTDDAFN